MFRTFPFLGESPWMVHGPPYGGVCELTAQPLLVLDLLSAPGEVVVVHWGAVKSITPGHPPRNTLLRGTSSLEMGVVLRPQLDVGGKFFVLLYVIDPYVRDPIGITFGWKGTDGGTD